MFEKQEYAVLRGKEITVSQVVPNCETIQLITEFKHGKLDDLPLHYIVHLYNKMKRLNIYLVRQTN